MKKTIFLILAGMLVVMLAIGGCERKVVIEHSELDDAATCFTCHGDNDALLVTAKAEWQNSVHGSGLSVDYTNRSSCVGCHDHQGYLERLATGEAEGPYENVTAIHCFTCHAPHTTGTLDLRVSEPYELESGDIFDIGKANLCVSCHHSRSDLTAIEDGYDPSTRFASHHGPQGDLLNGTGGYEMSGYDYGQSGHANAVEDGCIGCHMANPQVHDGYRIGGHSWNMEDEESGENLAVVCEDCHADADGFDFDADMDYDGDGEIEGYQTEVEGLLETLADLLIEEGVLDSTNYRPVGDPIADANVGGALENYGMIEEDRSMGIHNFQYIVSLLQNSIDYLEE